MLFAHYLNALLRITVRCVVRDCGAEIRLISCDAKLRFDVKDNRGTLRHFGTHTHDCPPVTAPDEFAMGKFARLIESAPECNPSRLIVGTYTICRHSLPLQLTCHRHN